MSRSSSTTGTPRLVEGRQQARIDLRAGFHLLERREEHAVHPPLDETSAYLPSPFLARARHGGRGMPPQQPVAVRLRGFGHAAADRLEDLRLTRGPGSAARRAAPRPPLSFRSTGASTGSGKRAHVRPGTRAPLDQPQAAQLVDRPSNRDARRAEAFDQVGLARQLFPRVIVTTQDLLLELVEDAAVLQSRRRKLSGMSGMYLI